MNTNVKLWDPYREYDRKKEKKKHAIIHAFFKMTPLISADESNIEEKKKDGGRVIPGTIRQAIHEKNKKK